MKASELIIALQEAIDEYGDLEVTYDAGAGRIEYVELIPKQNDWPSTPFFELIS